MDQFLEYKLKLTIDTIDKLNIRFNLLKITKNTIYTLEDLIKWLNFKRYFNFSYPRYEQFIKFIHKYTNISIPSRSRIFKFNKLLTKYSLNKQIYENYLENNIELITTIKSIDSSFITNKSCDLQKDFIGVNKYYHNKNGLKITNITNINDLPIYTRIDASNKHDSCIAKEMIEELGEKLKGTKLLGDTGYDSSELKEKLTKYECTYIIPQNVRNGYDNKTKNKIKNKTNEIKQEIKNEKTKIKEKIKTLRKTKELDKECKIKEEKLKMKQLTQEQKDKIKLAKIAILKRTKKKTKTERIKEFTINLSEEDKKIYKNRAKCEHIFDFIKSHGMDKIKFKTKNTFLNELYDIYVSYVVIKKIKKDNP